MDYLVIDSSPGLAFITCYAIQYVLRLSTHFLRTPSKLRFKFKRPTRPRVTTLFVQSSDPRWSSWTFFVSARGPCSQESLLGKLLAAPSHSSKSFSGHLWMFSKHRGGKAASTRMCTWTGPITPYPLPPPPPPPPKPRAVPGTSASAFLFFLEKEKIENCCVHICLSLGSPALFSASRLCQNSRRARDLAASHSSPDARLYNCAELIYWLF